MKIGELSKATGLSVETIRFYEKEGLIPEASRLENNYRTYGKSHLDRLLFIAHCRRLDMGLQEIREILNYNGCCPEEAEHVHELLHRQIRLVDQRIRDLAELKGKLIKLEEHCKGHREGELCGIIEELSSAE